MAAPGEWTFERSRRKGRSPGVSPGPLVHLVDIDNLLPEMTYFYEVQSADMSGNASEVILRSFRTLAEPDILAPTITLGPVITALSNTTAQIEWATDEDAAVAFTYRDNDLAVTVEDADRQRTHALVLNDLVPSTGYQYRITLTDGSGNSWVSPESDFTTLASPDTAPPVINSSPFVSLVLNDQAVVEWQTDESSDSAVEYGLTDDFGLMAMGAMSCRGT